MPTIDYDSEFLRLLSKIDNSIKEKVKKLVLGKKGTLAKAPGNSKLNGKGDHEPLNRATLAKAPATKKK